MSSEIVNNGNDKMTDSSIFITILNEIIRENEADEDQDEVIGKEFFKALPTFEEGGLLRERENAPDLSESQIYDLVEFINLIKQIAKGEEDGNRIEGEKFSPEQFLLLFRYFHQIGNTRMAAECVWLMAAIELKIFALKHAGIKLGNETSLEAFCDAIEIDEPSLDGFDSCEMAHSDGFCENILTLEEIQIRMEIAKEFVKILKDIKLPVEKVNKLKRLKFDEMKSGRSLSDSD